MSLVFTRRMAYAFTILATLGWMYFVATIIWSLDHEAIKAAIYSPVSATICAILFHCRTLYLMQLKR